MEKKPLTKASRYPSRQINEKDQIFQIMDETFFCTVAYVSEGQPYQIATGFIRKEDSILIHGSVKSHFLQQISDGRPVCISMFLYDGLVLAATAFDHSVNYRSVTIFSNGKPVHDLQEKSLFFDQFTDRYLPGRMADLPPHRKEEVDATTVVAFPITEVSCKVRDWGVGSDTSASGMWTGVIPARLSYGQPQPEETMNPNIQLPDYIQSIIKK